MRCKLTTQHRICTLNVSECFFYMHHKGIRIYLFTNRKACHFIISVKHSAFKSEPIHIRKKKINSILFNHRRRIVSIVILIIKLSRKFNTAVYFLMDMKMPIMGGLEATRKIRELNPIIPIIALTANAFDADRVSAMEAGCNAFLTKPLKKEELLELFSFKL